METNHKNTLAAALALAALAAVALYYTTRPAQTAQLPQTPDAPMAVACGNLPAFSADEPLKLRLKREECRSRQAADAYTSAWQQTLGK